MPKQNNFTNPLAIFISEHADLLVHLQKLNAAAKSINKTGITDKSLKIISYVLATLEYEIGHHNRMEETALFPVLEKYVDGPTQLLRDEHKQMARSFIKLHKTISKIKGVKFTKSQKENLVLAAQEVIHIFVNHIHKENYILFPLLKRFFSKEELKEVSEKMI